MGKRFRGKAKGLNLGEVSLSDPESQ